MRQKGGRTTPMAWTQTLPNGLYRACWRDEDGRQRSKSGFTQRAMANRFAVEQEGKIARGGRGYDGRGITWSEWKPEWQKRRRVQPASAKSDTGRIKKWIEPYWGKRRLAKIRHDDVQEWVNELEDTTDLSPTTIRMIFYVFSASMKAAVRAGHLEHNPASLTKLPAPIPVERTFLTRQEFDRILFHLNEPYRSAALILVGTGMRFGELAGLHWSRVDLVNKLVTIAETWDRADQKMKPFPKSGKTRVVPLPSFVLDTLAAMPVRAGATCGHPHAKGSRCTSPLVLYSVTGLPMDYAVMHDRWKMACTLGGVTPTRLHDVRHTYASWLRQDGVDLEVVQKLLGHGSIITTQIYSHIGSTQHQRVLRALGDREPERSPDVPL